MKSQSDVKKIIPANSTMNVATRGEFIFFKTGAAALRVVCMNDPVEMEPGDLRRFPAPFDSFEIQNESGVDQEVVFTVGFGEYNRLVVRGDISSYESILGVDGVARPDTRRREDFIIGMNVPEEFSLELFGHEQVYSYATGTAGQSGTAQGIGLLSDGTVLLVNTNGWLYKVNPVTSSVMASSKIDYMPYNMGFADHPVYGAVAFGVSSQTGKMEFYAIDSDLSINQIGSMTSQDEGMQFFPDGRVLEFDTVSDDLNIYAGIGGALVEKLDEQAVKAAAGLGGGQIFIDPVSNDSLWVFYSGQAARVGINSLALIEVVNMPKQPNAYSYFLSRWTRGNGIQLDFEILSNESGSFWGVGKVQSSMQQSFSDLTQLRFKKTGVIEKQNYNFLADKWTVDVINKVMAGYWSNAGKALPDDYMDYVHALFINGKEILNTGFSSFARENVTDIFTIENGATVGVVFTQELEPSLND